MEVAMLGSWASSTRGQLDLCVAFADCFRTTNTYQTSIIVIDPVVVEAIGLSNSVDRKS